MQFQHTDGNAPPLLAMDPVAKTRRPLSASTSDGERVVCNFGESNAVSGDLPFTVTVVDNTLQLQGLSCERGLS